MPISKCRVLSASLFGLLLGFVFLPLSAAAQTTAPNEWTWMGGSSTPLANGSSQPGVYGNLNSPATGNIPGGRDSSATWTDSSGNFWLFGGEGSDANANFGYLNDLWEFNPSKNEWTWMGGSSTLPASCAGSTTVTCGQPGVYGMLRTPAAPNVPGGRDSVATWTDSGGNFWLFGGEGFDANGTFGTLNDLWEFNPTSKEWTWMGGSSTVTGTCFDHDVVGYICVGEPGVYGNLGVSASVNNPGGRWQPTSWVDAGGQFWLYGGQGFDSQGNYGKLDDLWEFSPTTNEWTWMGGSITMPAVCEAQGIFTSLCGWPAVYGALGQPAPGISPGSRVAAANWSDRDGNLWLFGGLSPVYWEERSFSGIDQYDLWEFNPSTKQWAWMSGNSSLICSEGDAAAWCGQEGIYGTLGVPAISNIPPSRNNATTWTDTTGNLWLFGGQEEVTTYPEVFSSALCNDIWVFNPSANEWAWMNGNTEDMAFYGNNCSYAPGSWGVLGTPAAGNIPSGRYGSASWTDHSGNLWIFGGLGFGWINGLAVTSDLNDLWVYQPVPPAPTPSFELIASPNPINVGAIGSSVPAVTTATTTISVIVADGFDSPVTLTAASNTSNKVNDITGSFSPATITGADSSTLTISVTGAAEASTIDPTPLTITATGGGISQSIQVIVVVTTIDIDNMPIAGPSFSIPAGIYSTPQIVTIAVSTFNPAIYYTTDGTTPTASSPAYVNPITVASTTTLKAIQINPAFYQSAVSSANYNIILPGEDFSVAASPSSTSVTAGQSGTTTVTITPLNGFDFAVQFSCSGLPAGATCGFSPATVTPPGTTSTTLTVTTSATTAALHRNSSPLFPGSALAVALCCFGWKKRRRLQMFLLLAISVAGLSLLNGCGGGATGLGGSGGSSPTTSTVTVTATSGLLQQTTTFSLTVN